MHILFTACGAIRNTIGTLWVGTLVFDLSTSCSTIQWVLSFCAVLLSLDLVFFVGYRQVSSFRPVYIHMYKYTVIPPMNYCAAWPRRPPTVLVKGTVINCSSYICGSTAEQEHANTIRISTHSPISGLWPGRPCPLVPKVANRVQH